ncbi:AAA family ATPase [Saccharothrix variisporea]|uniref:ATPase family protein associated with various cellular activities (AAA) n=1 Tax=Saccharothrix variisporea TaxID=543527 RepID=A0A495X7G3_9PSEU|nr:ATP-binding protein [Saccharothrix variisporea]RKT69932.1 ATPase family protein associated with various cellular activities (AAA) [Saccharothrix variisporea]
MTAKLHFTPPTGAPDLRPIADALRRQLSGVHLEPTAVGTVFRVTLGSGESVDVRLSAVPVPGTVNGRSTIEFEAANALPAARSTAVPQPIADHLAHYLSAAAVAPAGPGGAAEDGVRRLRGVPGQAVVSDIATRLRGADSVRRWAARHHGSADLGALRAITDSTSLILLSGDPGTGKSALMRQAAPACAAVLGEDVMFLQLNERLRGQGIQGRAGSELTAAIQTIADVSEQYALPTIVFLDEADAVASSRGSDDIGSGAQENLAIVDGLIVAIDRVAHRDGARVVFVMATNLVDRIDPAILRRASVYSFDRPDAAARREIVHDLLGDVLDGPALDRLDLALARSGLPLTAADIAGQVVARAVREASALDAPLRLERLVELATQAVASSPVRRA